MDICRHCIISGRVQGVFFRQSTWDKAKALGLKGWVRNLGNGDVECFICGEESLIEQMCDWLEIGPPEARVTAIEIKESVWEIHHDFIIKR